LGIQADEHRWWAAALVMLGSVGLATCFNPVPGFWSNYVLDIVGPAWNYILLRGLFTNKPTPWSRFFTPEKALVLIAFVCVAIEAAQYFKLYEAHYDPYDFVAYLSLLVPIYLVDAWLLCPRRRA
jgi:hypothetical protein